MYCLKCKVQRDGAYCPECGSKLVENPDNPAGGLHLGDANAISGGIHYSETNNVNNNTTNNYNIVYEAQKTDAQIASANESSFFEAALATLSGGILDAGRRLELEKRRISLGIPESRADELVSKAKAFSLTSAEDSGNVLFDDNLLLDITSALDISDTDTLRNKLATLEKIAASSGSDSVHYYYNLLSASFYPESVVVNLLGAVVDDYWLLFWASISYLKLGDPVNATALLQKIDGFGRDKGNLSVLMAATCLYEQQGKDGDKMRTRANEYLENAALEGISPTLFPVWRALKDIAGQTAGTRPSFYISTTFKELVVFQPAPTAVGMNPQDIVLPQMQGFNPLVAANQMGLGNIQMIQVNKAIDKD